MSSPKESQIFDYNQKDKDKPVDIKNDVLTDVFDHILEKPKDKKVSQSQSIFEETMKNMKLVVCYDQARDRYHGKIYFHDEEKNVARLLIDMIDFY